MHEGNWGGRALGQDQAEELCDLGQVPVPSLGLGSLPWDRKVSFILQVLLETYYASGPVPGPRAPWSTEKQNSYPHGAYILVEGRDST